MQTFLPYPDFAESAAALDPLRLGKQRVEALQIIRALTRPAYGWKHHPAVLMWKGHEEALGRYGIEVCRVRRDRGFADTCEPKILADLGLLGVELVRDQDELAAAGALPPWLGDPQLHRSHQSALLRKDPELYGPVFPGVPADLPYVWPVRSEQAIEAERRKRSRARSRAARKGWRTRRADSR